MVVVVVVVVVLVVVMMIKMMSPKAVDMGEGEGKGLCPPKFFYENNIDRMRCN